MPGLHPCLHPRCPRLVRVGYCAEHGGQTAHPVQRMRGRQRQRARRALFREQPLCVRCLARGETRAAEVRDHRLALALGGTEDPANTQSLCRACNEEKRREEVAVLGGEKRWKS